MGSDQPLPTNPLTKVDQEWFASHFDDAVGQLIDFYAGDGLSLEDREVADIGCGDGIIDLGLTLQARPARMVGFDICPVDVGRLREMARQAGVADELPPQLEFVTSEAIRLPAEDASFDHVVSWSAFEHIADPVAVLREVRRILRPHGVVMIQLWPFFYSEHGSHLWDWFPEGFAHLTLSEDEVSTRVLAAGSDPEWAKRMLAEYPNLNRITVDDLHRALLAAGFLVAKLELLTNAIHIPPQLAKLPPSVLGIAGVKLLAVPTHDDRGG